MSRKHHSLQIWQEAMNFVKDIYEVTSIFPRHELYALTSQMRRAAISIPSNIAEGAGRFSNKEFLHYLITARGSLCELETQLILARELGYMQGGEVLEKINDLFGLLGGLINSIRSKSTK